MASGRRLVIIGGDAAGMSAASRLRRLDPSWDVVVFEASRHVSYAACGIPYYVSGDVPDFGSLLQVSPEDFRTKRGIDLHLLHRVIGIDRARKVVRVRDQEAGSVREQPYDRLLIATGAEPGLPAMEGLDEQGVFTVSGIGSALEIRGYLDEHRGELRGAVIIGGGYIGLEMAEAFLSHELDVTLLARLPRLPPGSEPEMAGLIQEELENQGATVLAAHGTTVLRGQPPGRVLALQDGSRIPADIVLVATGVRPRSELAADAGLSLGLRDAVVIDRQGRSSDPEVYAAGDCAEVYHRQLGRNVFSPLALSANRLGRVVAEHLAGLDPEFPGVLGTTTLKVCELSYARTGLSLQAAMEAGFLARKQTIRHSCRAHYYPGAARLTVSVVFDERDGQVLGAQMAGRGEVSKRIDVFVAGISAGMTVQQMAQLDLSYAPPFSPVYDPVVMACQVAAKELPCQLLRGADL